MGSVPYDDFSENDDSGESLIQRIEDYIENVPVRMHMPGHKGKRNAYPVSDGASGNTVQEILNGVRLMDLTETRGVDNLHYPKGVIEAMEQRFARVFGVARSFLLVNGGTGGILAAFLALRMTMGNGYVILPRNVHRSIISALILSGLEPIFLNSKYDSGQGGYLPLDAQSLVGSLKESLELEQKLRKNAKEDVSKMIRGVFLVNPTYYGTSLSGSGFSLLLQGVAKTFGKIPIIVDECHGTHFGFSPLVPPSARSLATSERSSTFPIGPDIIIHGAHKTTIALTQSGLLHVTKFGKARFPELESSLEESLRWVESSSPSYVLMASLEELLSFLKEDSPWVRRGAMLGLDLAKRLSRIPSIAVANAPPTRDFIQDPFHLNVDVSALGLRGPIVQDMLWKRWRIQAEMAGESTLLFIVTGNDNEDDLKKIEEAFGVLSLEAKSASGNLAVPRGFSEPPTPKKAIPISQAVFARSLELDLRDTIGRISCDTIMVYPPGIPALIPGERIDEGIVQYLENAQKAGLEVLGRGTKMHGGQSAYPDERELRVLCVECS